MLSLLLSLSLFVLTSFSAKVYKATFTAGVTGVAGTVKLNNGRFKMDLTVENSTIRMRCPTNKTFAYHIHAAPVGNNAAEGIEGNCDAASTKGHIDQGHACGAASTETLFCNKTGNDAKACILTSAYSCDMSMKDKFPYNCELGDLSGIFGKVTQNATTNKLMVDKQSEFLIRNDEIADTYSIVFHCADGSRAFCANFVKDDSTDAAAVLPQADTVKTLTATFKNLGTSMFTLMNTNIVKYKLDLKDAKINTNGKMCPNDDWQFIIWNAQTNATKEYGMDNDDCHSLVAKQWDPTKSCYGALSEQPADICFANGKLCDQATGVYNCNRAKPMTTCSPADLSGLYNINPNPKATANQGGGLQTLENQYLPSLKIVKNKYLVLQCKAKIDNKIWMSGCAKLKDAADTPAPTTPSPSTDAAYDAGSKIYMVTMLMSLLFIVF